LKQSRGQSEGRVREEVSNANARERAMESRVKYDTAKEREGD
jgi:hypothetical protein